LTILFAQAVDVTTPPTGQVYDPADPKDVPSAESLYDSEGRAYASKDALGHYTRSYFDALERTVYTTVNLPEQYLDDSLTTPPAHDPGHPDQILTTQTIYDRAGRVIASIFHQAGCIVTETNGEVTASAECIVTRIYYDDLGQAVTSVQNLVGQTITASDPPARNASLPEQNVRTDTIYDSLGQAIATIDPAGVITRTYTDRLGRMVAVTRNLVGQAIDETITNPPGFDQNYPDRNVTRKTSYDVSGNVTDTHTVIDALDASPVVTHFVYDSLQRLTAVIENYRPGETATHEVNVRTEYTYDVLGNRLTIRDAQAVLEGRSDVTCFQYDALSRLVQEQDPLLHGSSYVYDLLGNRSSVTDAMGATTIWVYDALGRLKTIDYPAPDSDDVTFLYNQLDRRTSMMDGTGTTTWSYDGVGRVTSIDDPLNAAVGYGYDAMGNRTALTYPNGKKLVYVPNALGQIKEVQERVVNGWTADHTVNYTYQPSGQLATAAVPNGVTSTYTYDALGRLTDLVHGTTSASLAQYHYQYNALGNRVQAIERVQQPLSTAVPNAPGSLTAEQRGYQNIALRWQDNASNETHYLLERSTDGFHWQAVTSLNRDTIRYVDSGLLRHTQYWYRVVARNGETLRAESPSVQAMTAFDPVIDTPLVQTPGMLTISYTYDPLSRLTAADYDTGAYYHYTYDSNGNRLNETTHLSITPVVYDYNEIYANRLESVNGVTYTWDNNGNLTSDGQRNYGYDSANRLTSITDATNTTSFGYNGLGNRVQETVNGETLTFAIDFNTGLTQVLQEKDSTEAVKNTYLYGNGRIMQQSASDSAYFLGDALGSVRQLVNGGGAITLAKEYEPYGEVMYSQGSGASNYGYTGEWASTNLLYLRSRYYSGDLGRFLTKDTWQGDYNTPSTLNSWIYTGNNPINRIDPTGKWYCQTGLIPNHSDCINWVNNGLQKLQAGPTGQKVAGYFNMLDATLNALRRLFECSPLQITIRYPLTLKVIFEPVIPNILGANAFTISPNEIHINSSIPGYSGSVPSTTAVVTFGHEITHLDQLGAEFSVQAEMLSTIVGYYLEEEQGEPHRVDATTIIEGHLNPWNNDDLALYKRSFQLPWPLVIGNGLPRNWLGKWNIILPDQQDDPQRPVT
jgi:RHS repeat-associated protein